MGASVLKVVRFPVYVGKKYYEVLIFKRHDSMKKFAKEFDDLKLMKNYLALTVEWRKPLGNDRGMILFCERYMGSGIVAHELAHALIWIWGKDLKKIHNNLRLNEKFAQQTESLNTQFWNKFYKYFPATKP